jgi:hypothetical protein
LRLPGEEARLVVKYDPATITKAANELYIQASRIVAQAIIISIVFGFALYAGVGMLVRTNAQGAHIMAVIIAAVIGAYLYTSAQRKAFELRLEAQAALCQVQIEENTRPSVISIAGDIQRVHLLGIISRVFTRTDEGVIVQAPAPTRREASIAFEHMIDLGARA